MHPVIRNILAVVAGAVAGGAVNMAIIMVSSYVIAPPAGVDVNNMNTIVDHIHEYQPIHFLMPFLAHALGTLVGAFVAALLAVSHHKIMALIVGALFLLGGISAVAMIPAPMWFNIVDLGLAYLPMGWLGGWLAARVRK